MGTVEWECTVVGVQWGGDIVGWGTVEWRCSGVGTQWSRDAVGVEAHLVSIRSFNVIIISQNYTNRYEYTGGLCGG